MDEDTRLKQLDTLIKTIGGGKKHVFAKRIGVSNARVGMWYTRKYLDVQLVADSCPEISAEWLLRNVGEPFDASVPPTTFTRSTPNDEKVKFLEEENARLKSDLEKANKERDMLFAKLMTLI